MRICSGNFIAGSSRYDLSGLRKSGHAVGQLGSSLSSNCLTFSTILLLVSVDDKVLQELVDAFWSTEFVAKAGELSGEVIP